MTDNTRENDLILAPNEYAYISDMNSGRINLIVGPTKYTLGNTDQPMILDAVSGKFLKCRLLESVQLLPTADERSYIVLQNPAIEQNGEIRLPKSGTTNNPVELNHGQTVILEGPRTLALWTGQIAQVIPGHQLRSNQYLITRVLNAKAANENYEKATVELVRNNDTGTKEKLNGEVKDFVTGQLDIIKGTDVSFYIPPTGIEVVPDREGNFVRDAVTVERLEYAVLIDESGEKRYAYGPDVVFPKPTETFVERSKTSHNRVFKCMELNHLMGIYVKVIAPYIDETYGPQQQGDELFITGDKQRIYYPRAEHSIIKYDAQVIHYAVQIGKGEARYVLNKETGEVKTVRGECMYLADPRKEVFVKRELSAKDVALMYPNNEEAAKYNTTLRSTATVEGYHEVDMSANKRRTVAGGGYSRSTVRLGEWNEEDNFNDTLDRNNNFTPPRSISLNNKYDGAVRVNVWPGYAVQVVSKTGERNVIIGPQAILLDYDQSLEVLSLSKGRPKTTNNIKQDIYLRVKNNTVVDKITVETSDLVNIDIELAYRVDFNEEEQNKWFNVENYVQFLCDHMRSVIRNHVKKIGVEQFYSNSIDIIRDTVLGKSVEGVRVGKLFHENGMNIYDVAILGVLIGDETIAQMLLDAQHNAVARTLKLTEVAADLKATKQIEEAKRIKIAEERQTTAAAEKAAAEALQAQLDSQAAELKAEVIRQEDIDEIAECKLARRKAENDEKIRVEMDLTKMTTDAVVTRLSAVSDKLVAAIKAGNNAEIAKTIAENLPEATGTIGFLSEKGGIGGLLSLVKNTPLAKTFQDALSQLADDEFDK